LILALSIAFIGFQSFYFVRIKTLNPIDAIPIGVESILILVFSFYFFFEQLKRVTTPIYENYFFWMVIGLIFYLAGSFFIYILSSTITNKELRNYWFLTYIFDIVKNIFFVFATIIFLRQSNSLTKKSVLPNLDFN
jgi:Co/Zn/Cd efflux system component